MSSTPIYDELAAILLVDQPTKAEPGRPVAPEPVEQPPKQVRTGGRRRKPEPDA
ncbi:hypothetical protein [Saccharothrix australiensis]|uniref:Uncharacterized protein n=1 Tax=Saccharothrix australiensis TaxID=2072 RepID=A0A495W306_9PSEU|nr:hypothetical protein [Saccharothrix australiensis]RKT55869.1 hypothetical protein C8E97_4557 [Saccharothrix australiensis]